MDGAEVERRDQVVRAYFRGRDWDKGAEFGLARELVLNSAAMLPDFPFLIDHEWEVVPGSTTFGRGDLIFTDGRGRFAVVEVKTIEGSGSRTNRRTKVEEQAIRYAREWRNRFPDALVSAFVYTDDYLFPGLRSADAPRQAGRVVGGVTERLEVQLEALG